MMLMRVLAGSVRFGRTFNSARKVPGSGERRHASGAKAQVHILRFGQEEYHWLSAHRFFLDRP
ncbi:MAG TPA: hypothetical protein VIJ90_04010 [Gemmatimonadaceae bacterium]